MLYYYLWKYSLVGAGARATDDGAVGTGPSGLPDLMPRDRMCTASRDGKALALRGCRRSLPEVRRVVMYGVRSRWRIGYVTIVYSFFLLPGC